LLRETSLREADWLAPRVAATGRLTTGGTGMTHRLIAWSSRSAGRRQRSGQVSKRAAGIFAAWACLIAWLYCFGMGLVPHGLPPSNDKVGNTRMVPGTSEENSAGTHAGPAGRHHQIFQGCKVAGAQDCELVTVLRCKRLSLVACERVTLKPCHPLALWLTTTATLFVARGHYTNRR